MAHRSDREPGHPAECPRRHSLHCRVGPSSRIPSGPAVKCTTASTGRTEDCTRPMRQILKSPLATREPSTEDVHNSGDTALNEANCSNTCPHDAWAGARAVVVYAHLQQPDRTTLESRLAYGRYDGLRRSHRTRSDRGVRLVTQHEDWGRYRLRRGRHSGGPIFGACRAVHDGRLHLAPVFTDSRRSANVLFPPVTDMPAEHPFRTRGLPQPRISR